MENMFMTRNRFRLFWKNNLYLKLFSILSIIIIYYKLLYQRTIPNNKYRWLEKNRNISYFLRNYESHPLKCKEDINTIIAVISAPSHSPERNAIRVSWGQNLPATWKLLFFIGESQNAKLEDSLKKEREDFQDLVQLYIEDSYLNLTLKVSLVLKWVNDFCPQPKFLLKLDDDIYINLPNMQQFIYCLSFVIENRNSIEIPTICDRWPVKDIVGMYKNDSNLKKYESYVAAGYLYGNIPPDRNIHSKWYTSPTLFPEAVFPTFLSGTSYLLSLNLIPLIFKHITQIPLLHLEDVYITGILISHKLNLKLSHVEGWNNFRPRWDDACLYKTILTAHGLTPNEMQQITKAVNNVKDCKSPLSRLFLYINKFISYYIPKYKI